MPELPEVETTARGIAPYITGVTLTGIDIRQPQLRWPVPEDLGFTLAGKRVEAVSRRGKYVLWQFTDGVLLVHLGMSGSLRVITQPVPPGKHDHIDFLFAGGVVLRFNDPRRFGCVLWSNEPIDRHPLIKDLGPEPLSEDFSGLALYSQSRNRKTPVKSFIMDSHVVVGVGNIYANEALFLAGIHPTRPVGRISKTRYLKLADCIRLVLIRAIEQGGTTLRDFVNEAGKPGYFQQQLSVYGRKGEPCRQCSNALEEIRISNRSTVFCRLCQT